MIPQSEFRNPTYQDLIHFTREALGLTESVAIELSPLEGRGSDRTFFRLRWNEKDSAILIHYDPRRVENTLYADIANFLREIHVAVPQIVHHDPVQSLIVVEDLGDRDLWSLREAPWESRRILYQKTLAIAHRLHSFPERDFPAGRVRLMESFGPELYRWERDYFRNHFVREVCGIELRPPVEQELEAELSGLSERLSGSIRCLVHRDLQSQNVMIRDGEPLLIDFQGMRFGSLFYDLGSLLCDPYVNLSESERGELLSFYYRLSSWDLDWVTFQNIFWEASAQRLMQALGAYGSLGLKKGLKAYLEHIPSGLRNLRLATSHVSTLPRLRELSDVCGRSSRQKNLPGDFE
ncbi:MAG: aminoglycoside phosphotransferase family protein [Thermodesulfobacteriota bacterium]